MNNTVGFALTFLVGVIVGFLGMWFYYSTQETNTIQIGPDFNLKWKNNK